MACLAAPTEQVLQALRQRGGIVAAAGLQQAPCVSQPTMPRLLRPLVQSGQIKKARVACSQRYLLARVMAGLVGRHGAGVARCYAYPARAIRSGLHAFLGGFFRDDSPGNLIVSEAVFACFHLLPGRASRVDSSANYPRLADAATQGTLPGPPAGGEQPKPCTITAGRPVLFKFSPAGNAPADQSVRDLRVCKYLALLTLAQAGVLASSTQIIFAAGRVFLKSERFDRTVRGLDPENTLGETRKCARLHRHGAAVGA